MMQSNAITVLPMGSEHIKAVAALETVCFADPWSEASIASELKNPLSLWLVACADGVVAGYVGSQSVLGEADMMNLAVAPAYRRQGIAKALLAALESELSQRDVHSITLEVRQSNEAARTLYQQNGYEQVGLRPGYYRNPKEDALILRKQWGNEREDFSNRILL